MAKQYTVSDGKLALTLKPIGKGRFLVRSPMDPEVLTSASSISEAFENAYDALKALRASRRKWMRRQASHKAA
jgi:hypothetical protein